jgi:two-component system response regulator HydG
LPQKTGVILVVDDARDHADGIVESLETQCDKAIAVYSGADALEILRSRQIDVVVTDLKLDGDTSGLTVLTEAKKYDIATEVILITAYATIDTCKEALKLGAYDYLVKPIDIGQLRTLVARAAEKSATAHARQAEEPEVNKEGFVFEGVLGKSPGMQGVFEVIKRVAPTNISVLIEGQSGTGKDLLARAIHDNSQRWDKPFKPVNCAGLSETLLESELFGHVAGAFTGASSDRKGLFEVADKGTLFLDEIGDMAGNSQAKLLRVIEDGVIIPVGSNKHTVVDVRIISATNQNLAELIEERKFRQDLYFRIKGVNISLPPLRDRLEDLPELVDYFLKEAASETGSEITGITDAAMDALKKYDWPGNIRQLRNTIRTMVVMCDRDRLDLQDIPPEITQRRQLIAGSRGTAELGDVSLDELEKQAIEETLAKTQGNREKTAKILGIGERTLYRKIKEYNL